MIDRIEIVHANAILISSLNQGTRGLSLIDPVIKGASSSNYAIYLIAYLTTWNSNEISGWLHAASCSYLLIPFCHIYVKCMSHKFAIYVCYALFVKSMSTYMKHIYRVTARGFQIPTSDICVTYMLYTCDICVTYPWHACHIYM